ncbi:MAG: hypothetical protein D3910_02540, partial [Candidatus Electrothrix sp. ATG2]|nr:hypothetical protein [Candidatus Electrothrix sp. ATG2]
MQNPSARLLVTVDKTSLQVRRCDEERSRLPVSVPKLSPDDILSLKNSKVSLADLSQALIDFDQEWIDEYLDERGQLEVGQYLYQQIFARVSPYDFAEDGTGVELRITTKDEDIARLPWALLAHEGVFLATMGWAISLATDIQAANCELPPRPQILALAPQPKELEATGADEHLREVREMLTAADLAYSDESHLKVVTDLSSFRDELDALRPDILYYYGHGIGNRQTTRLLFADQQGRAVETPLPDL